jgi:ribonuclease D
MTTSVWVDDDSVLHDCVRQAMVCDRYALDTEFHREKTYYPQLALIQVNTGTATWLVDPLACDVTLLGPLFASPSLCVIHAAQQDLEVLRLACGTAPRRIFDTQIAAGFLGMSTPSLSSLVQATAKVTLPKADRLTDWLRRPLTDAQRRYAAADVEYLLDIHARQVERLQALGRLAWVEGSCEELRSRPNGPVAPDRAWLRVKDVKTLKGEARGVAQAVAEWRELRAMGLDIPPRRVLSDMALLVIASSAPSTADELMRCRGVDGRAVSAVADEIVESVRRGRQSIVKFPTSGTSEIDPRYRAVVPLVMAWVGEIARIHEVDPTILATRQDVEEFIAGVDSCRLRNGWRKDMVGSDLAAILGGSAALRFDGAGRLELVKLP